MNIEQTTQAYERWMAGHFRLLRTDLAAKHAHMVGDPFSFLRATFYRWAQLFPALCPELARSPKVLGVGDLHAENYGTWRDAEGRLNWGINDFDEASPLPYTNDLVRLATSACLAIELKHLPIRSAVAYAAILEGYTDGLKDGGQPFVLSERNRWLRTIVTSRLRDPTLFWKKLAALPSVRRVPDSVRSLLKRAMPEAGLEFRVAHRQAGLGSLGRPRFTAIADWNGGKIAREAKALLPSAWLWAGGGAGSTRVFYNTILRGAVRAADPCLQMHERWILRRLSPYCSRIELSQIPRERDSERLLRAMGYELANVHLGTSGTAVRVGSDLRRRKSAWLRQSSEVMAAATLKDWKRWRKIYA